MEGKKTQLKVYIPERLDDEFRNMVARKYDRIERGLISREVEEALVRYLASSYKQSNTQTHDTKIAMPLEYHRDMPPVVVIKLKNDIRRFLKESGKYEDEYMKNVLQEHLKEAIGYIKGFDSRTFQKWTNLLERYGCIKRAGPQLWELSDF